MQFEVYFNKTLAYHCKRYEQIIQPGTVLNKQASIYPSKDNA